MVTQDTLHEPVTKAIFNKGFGSKSSILPRSTFGGCGQESSPQSLTAYSRNRYLQPVTTVQTLTDRQKT